MSNTLDQDAFQRIKNRVEQRVIKTKDINVADILTGEDKYWIARVIDARVKAEYGDMYPFKWQMSVSGHFQIPETL